MKKNGNQTLTPQPTRGAREGLRDVRCQGGWPG
jgi:hypothetical protein